MTFLTAPRALPGSTRRRSDLPDVSNLVLSQLFHHPRIGSFGPPLRRAPIGAHEGKGPGTGLKAGSPAAERGRPTSYSEHIRIGLELA
jgi:hypothetical protein